MKHWSGIDDNGEESIKEICVNDPQNPKISAPIIVTEGGIAIWIKDKHWLKACSPILIIEQGFSNVICDNDLQFWKASSPISLTEDGIEILDNNVQSSKVLPPIDVKDDEIFILFNDEHPKNVPDNSVTDMKFRNDENIY